MRRLGVVLVLVSLSVMFLWVPPAYAQEPTPTETPAPTLTPTPSYMLAVPMSTGSELLITKSVTFGDIAVVSAILILSVIELGQAFIKIPRMWWKNGR